MLIMGFFAKLNEVHFIDIINPLKVAHINIFINNSSNNEIQ